jgi:N-acetylmuramoyl-L-alanine amidase
MKRQGLWQQIPVENLPAIPKGLAIALLGYCFLLPLPPTLAQQQSPSLINRPVLSLGSQGADVANLQAALKLLGYYTGSVDGMYAESTVIAVFLFQQAASLNATGIVDAATWTALFPTAPTVTPPPSRPAPPPASTSITPRPASDLPTLRLGMSGPAVRRLQERLRALGFSVGVDGVFGEQTLQAAIAVQQKFKLNPDGVVGPATWRVLLGR